MFKSIVLLLPILLPVIGGLVVFRMRDAKARRIAVSACVLCTLVSAVGVSFLPDLPCVFGTWAAVLPFIWLDAMGRFSCAWCQVSGRWWRSLLMSTCSTREGKSAFLAFTP
ncbi:MAG: hypothetical protein ACLT0Y_05775 [Christensenellales bacterium]